MTASALAQTAPSTHDIPRFLDSLYARLLSLKEGAVANYIPELARADPDRFAIAVATPDGQIFEAGDTRLRFTIQSASKPFTYGLALETWGEAAVLACVGVEPTGDAFNSIVLERGTGRPLNPMVNAGAIAVTDLIGGDDAAERLHRLLDCFRGYVGHSDLFLDMATFASERATSHRNRAIAYLLSGANALHSSVDDALDLYFGQCSLLVNCRDMALMAATLANGGRNPLTGSQAVAGEYVKNILSVMYTCGMYDSAGEWAYRVGLPAKSGVSGGILAVAPGRMGIAVYSPRVDAHGNSVRGIRACEAISEAFGLHLFRAP